MARYDYRCPSCGLTFEVEHPMGERPRIVCPDCGAEAARVFDASGIVLKGTGFYNTDERRRHMGSVGAKDGSDAPLPGEETSTPAPAAEKKAKKPEASTTDAS